MTKKKVATPPAKKAVKPTGKTVDEYLEELPHPYNALALFNYRKNPCCSRATEPYSLEGAVGYAFQWDESVEGSEFWEEVYNAIEKNLPYPKLDFSKKRLVGIVPDYTVTLSKEKGLEIGCQTITLEKFRELEREVNNFFGEG